jgi:hypothetical protein
MPPVCQPSALCWANARIVEIHPHTFLPTGENGQHGLFGGG